MTTTAAVNAVAEAVRGLAVDRSVLLKKLAENMAVEPGYPFMYAKFCKDLDERISAIDKRIDGLLNEPTSSTSRISTSAFPPSTSALTGC